MAAKMAFSFISRSALAPRGEMQTRGLSAQEVEIIVVLEKSGASLSMIGITLIFVTYWACKRVRTVPNLFILFASIANVGASVACVMGHDGIRAGLDTSLCQAQGFLLEM